MDWALRARPSPHAPVLLLGFFVWSVSRLFWLLHAGPSNESESGQADRAVVFPARFCVLCSPSFGLETTSTQRLENPTLFFCYGCLFTRICAHVEGRFRRPNLSLTYDEAGLAAKPHPAIVCNEPDKVGWVYTAKQS
jgi:hypothetical protein